MKGFATNIARFVIIAFGIGLLVFMLSRPAECHDGCSGFCTGPGTCPGVCACAGFDRDSGRIGKCV